MNPEQNAGPSFSYTYNFRGGLDEELQRSSRLREYAWVLPKNELDWLEADFEGSQTSWQIFTAGAIAKGGVIRRLSGGSSLRGMEHQSVAFNPVDDILEQGMNATPIWGEMGSGLEDWPKPIVSFLSAGQIDLMFSQLQLDAQEQDLPVPDPATIREAKRILGNLDRECVQDCDVYAGERGEVTLEIFGEEGYAFSLDCEPGGTALCVVIEPGNSRHARYESSQFLPDHFLSEGIAITKGIIRREWRYMSYGRYPRGIGQSFFSTQRRKQEEPAWEIYQAVFR